MEALGLPDLVTPRLRLRSLRADDWEALAALLTDAAVMRHIGGGVRAPAAARGEARRFIARRRSDDPDDPGGPGIVPGLGVWAIEGRDDGEFHGGRDWHGWAGLIPLDLDEGREIQLAYRLARASWGSWGRGLATEAGRALVAHGFGPLALPRIAAVTAPENRASQRVLEKLAFTYAGPRRAYGIDGCLYYVLERGAD